MFKRRGFLFVIIIILLLVSIPTVIIYSMTNNDFYTEEDFVSKDMLSDGDMLSPEDKEKAVYKHRMKRLENAIDNFDETTKEEIRAIFLQP